MTLAHPLSRRRPTSLLAFGFMFAASAASLSASVPRDPIVSEPGHLCDRRPIDLVICLDTSGSMTGLIDSARARLWDIVTSLSRARPMPSLRVGLLTYGSPSRSTAAAGWVARQTDLTSDLDTVYAKMMSLTTVGGDEFVGWVLNDAVEKMSWSGEPSALRLVFVAGNESADQASEVFDFRRVAERARARGITINAIFAGHRQNGISEHWDQVALHGGGSYSAIDMECGTVQVETPHDKLLLELNMKLNATYLPYGAMGEAGRNNQVEQDHAAKELGVASAASRAEAKATALYDNAHWDLVDAVAKSKGRLNEIKKDDLPAAMQPMNETEQQAFLEQTRIARAEIQRQIAETQTVRGKYLREARAKAAGGKTALDDAMLDTIRRQAKEKGFEFE